MKWLGNIFQSKEDNRINEINNEILSTEVARLRRHNSLLRALVRHISEHMSIERCSYCKDPKYDHVFELSDYDKNLEGLYYYKEFCRKENS